MQKLVHPKRVDRLNAVAHEVTLRRPPVRHSDDVAVERVRRPRPDWSPLLVIPLGDVVTPRVFSVEVLEARISHLAYAPEIAAAMLQRQQAGAIIAARSRIVEGAVGMVEMALDMLSKKSIVNLDEERKAQMVSNLLVVLCGERSTQPVINAGTIYQ